MDSGGECRGSNSTLRGRANSKGLRSEGPVRALTNLTISSSRSTQTNNLCSKCYKGKQSSSGLGRTCRRSLRSCNQINKFVIADLPTLLIRGSRTGAETLECWLRDRRENSALNSVWPALQ